MRERVYGLAYEMKALWVSLTVEFFKLNTPLEEILIRKEQLISWDAALIDDPDSSDKLTEVGIVRLGQETVEHARTKAVQIVKKFPGFIATRDLLLRISRGPAE